MTKISYCQMKDRDLLGLFRSSHRRCSIKKVVLKKFANFTGKTSVLESLFKACNLFKRDSKAGVFLLRTSILKNIYKRLLLFVSPESTISNSSGDFS